MSFLSVNVDESEGSSEGGEYGVQEIRAKRIDEEGKVEYQEHWKGYGTEEDTWEPKANLACSAML